MKSSTNASPAAQQKEADQLIANISQLMAEAEEMLSESTSQHAEEKVELLRPGFYDQERRSFPNYAAAKARVLSAARRTDDTIRAYPYEALAVAVGLGMLLGAVCFRRRI